VQRAFALGDGQITAIHDGVDTSVFRPLEVAKRPRSVLFVGNSDDRNKGARYLIEAAAILRDRGVPFHLTFVDRQNAEMVPRMVRELALANRVTFTGRLSTGDLVRAYNEAQVMVSPSLYEGFGLPAAEAMACGTPVVASDVGGLSYTVEDGVTGFLVPKRDPLALADRICDILNDESMRDQLGRQARQVAQRYSWQHVADCIEDVYREFIPGGYGPGPASLPLVRVAVAPRQTAAEPCGRD
jgi:glycosyltransferase involved in cell wall biosynthesis